MSIIRWGILGTGSIAGQFARGLAALDDAKLVAVGSRTAAAAAGFAQRVGAERAHGSYAELAHDPQVDAIYIATPHPLHHANTLLCLGAGKAVLCEKPFAINAGEAAAMIDAARARGLFLMEAMWTRFLPHMLRLRELLAAGVIGELRMLQADFGFRTEFNPHSRLFDPALGGGALLDVGIYPVSLASMLWCARA
ncbi:MAG: Gfo/Idh/MocA family oxidoreductase [Kouleothrix sp.]